jgi:hypothetical protein
VVEEGSHEELLRRGDHYARLYAIHSGQPARGRTDLGTAALMAEPAGA